MWVKVVLDYISDTGIRSPVLLDNPTLLDGCLELPVGEDSLYQHFEDRVGLSTGQAPFPLQIVLDANGAIAYTSKTHQPEVVLETIHGLLGE